MQNDTNAEGQVLVMDESGHSDIAEKLQPSHLRPDKHLVNIMVAIRMLP